MKRILINSGISTNLRSEHNLLNYIEIEEKPFAVGGFGEVYNCLTLNGKIPQIKQVVKIFIDNSKGSAEHNFKTTQRLQKKIDGENQKLLNSQNKTILEVYPPFKGIPQFSFRGNINGAQIIGFISDNLVDLGFIDFENFLLDLKLLSQYQQFPIEKKMLLASQLVSSFKVLEDFQFIHADLKPGALFINLTTTEIAVIDYDSGVITENYKDEPLTWGAANDWVAPEIWEQQSKIQKGEKIKVDIYSDRWSVAIGVHYLITTFHPLFYLTELSPRVANQYFSPQNKWPYINKKAPYFQSANENIYDQYLPWITSTIPKVVFEKLANTINYGYKNPVARTSYNDWKVALISLQEPAKINFFSTNKSAILKGVDVELSWEIENAHLMELVTINLNTSNEILRQVILEVGNLVVRPSFDTRYVLFANGYFGNASPKEIDILVFPTPIIERLIIPVPEFNQRVSLGNIKISSPYINVSLNHNYIKDIPQFTKGSRDLQTVRKTHLPKRNSLSLLELYERLITKLSGKR